MLISPYYRRDIEVVDCRSCHCIEDYDENGPNGRVTEMVYLGEGRYMCPECGTVDDIHEVVYRIIVKIVKNLGFTEATIINPILDPRLKTKQDPNLYYDPPPTLRILQEAINEDLWDEFDHHKPGIFEMELLYNVYRCGGDEEEYDEEMDIISERELQVEFRKCGCILKKQKTRRNPEQFILICSKHRHRISFPPLFSSGDGE